MPRVLYRDARFERVASHSWLESEYEDLVLQRAADIFPRWNAVRFNAAVTLDGVTKKPDLALVDQHYRQWWVVEVELAHHSLTAHVLPQVEVFAGGRYAARHADWIADHNPGLDRDRLTQMMLGEPPGVLVVVDTAVPKWERELAAGGIHLSLVEPFSDLHGEYLLRVNGFQPEPPGAFLTRCVRATGLARMWTVESPATLPPPDEDSSYVISHDGVPTRWHRVALTDSVMLRADRGDALPELSAVHLILRDDGSLEFVGARSTRRRSK